MKWFDSNTLPPIVSESLSEFLIIYLDYGDKYMKSVFIGRYYEIDTIVNSSLRSGWIIHKDKNKDLGQYLNDEELKFMRWTYLPENNLCYTY